MRKYACQVPVILHANTVALKLLMVPSASNVWLIDTAALKEVQLVRLVCPLVPGFICPEGDISISFQLQLAFCVSSLETVGQVILHLIESCHDNVWYFVWKQEKTTRFVSMSSAGFQLTTPCPASSSFCSSGSPCRQLILKILAMIMCFISTWYSEKIWVCFICTTFWLHATVLEESKSKHIS